MKVMLTGGGTLGPVTPLLAVVEAWRWIDPAAQFVWIGTPRGPERLMIEAETIPFHPLSVPKFDRHAPGKWILIPWRLLWSIKLAWHLIQRERPDVVATAGAYVSVPLIWAARLYGLPTWVHQQDVRPGLANKLMAPFATKISVAWTRSLHHFPKEKTMVLGNPVRASILRGAKKDAARLMILVMGGGTGAAWINRAVIQIVPELTRRADVVHITGKGKNVAGAEAPAYRSFELLTTEMSDALAEADLVICRAGMGTISELAALSKPAIVIPMPDSHQEDNAAALDELGAAVVLNQEQTTPQMLLTTINGLLDNPSERQKLGARLHAALPTEGVAETLAHHLQAIVKSTKN